MNNCRRKKPVAEYKPVIGYRFHHIFAKSIVPMVADRSAPNTIIKSYYSFFIKESCDTPQEVVAFENAYLKLAKGDNKCLNTKFDSAYNCRPKGVHA